MFVMTVQGNQGSERKHAKKGMMKGVRGGYGQRRGRDKQGHQQRVHTER